MENTSRISIDDYENNLKNGVYDLKEVYKPRYWDKHYVISEDLTIKENKRLIEEHNQMEKEKLDKSIAERRNIGDKKRQDFRAAMQSYLDKELDDSQMGDLVRYINDNVSKDNGVKTYINDVVELLDLINKIIKN